MVSEDMSGLPSLINAEKSQMKKRCPRAVQAVASTGKLTGINQKISSLSQLNSLLNKKRETTTTATTPQTPSCQRRYRRRTAVCLPSSQQRTRCAMVHGASFLLLLPLSPVSSGWLGLIFSPRRPTNFVRENCLAVSTLSPTMSRISQDE